jgi:hypothetical protein
MLFNGNAFNETRSGHLPLSIRRRCLRPVYDAGKRQYIFDDDGYKVHGIWLIPEDESDLPLIVPADEDKQ